MGKSKNYSTEKLVKRKIRIISHLKMMISPFFSFFFAIAPRGCNRTDYYLHINTNPVLAAITTNQYCN